MEKAKNETPCCTYKWFYHCRGSALLQALCPQISLGKAGNRSLPSSAMTVSVTVTPASLISWTMLSWDSSTMDCPFTAEIWSPTFSFPQRSAGLPSMTRPILWGITMKKKSSQVFQLFNISLSIGFIISIISIKFNLITKKILPRYIRKNHLVIIYPNATIFILLSILCWHADTLYTAAIMAYKVICFSSLTRNLFNLYCHPDNPIERLLTSSDIYENISCSLSLAV